MTEPASKSAPRWSEAHRRAIEAGEPHYRDPETGYRVFTEIGLRGRGECCGCGCRHCPWAHESIAMPERAARIVRPAMLFGERPAGPIRVLFWSGGKDSFLALRAMIREQRSRDDIVLLTTFGLPKRVVAHQELAIADVVAQAEAVGLPLAGVPLPPGADYIEVMGEALKWLAAGLASGEGVAQLVFGDLHLDHIRNWREEALATLLGELGATTRYPLWSVDYASLMEDFVASQAKARVCAAPDRRVIAPVEVGHPFGPSLVASLPAGVDAFGENGEFHTYVEPTSLRNPRALS